VFLDLCYSGCMFHSLKNQRAFEDKDYYCGSYKRYFEHVLRRLHADLTRARHQLDGHAERPADLPARSAT
jgi:sulfatase maturation enzyme AslB (radical SAM superfamily)